MNRRAGVGATARINSDVITGLLLAVGGCVWTAMVLATIPAGGGDGDVGARAFPLVLGVALVLMSAGLMVCGFKTGPSGATPSPRPEGGEADNPLAGSAYKPAILIFLHVVAYGLLMQQIGFLFASIVTVAALMLICLADRSPLRIAAMSFGVPLGVWLVFGKLFGVYLPPASLF